MSTPLLWPIDPIYLTQGFGLNRGAYSRFGILGHNGLDLRTRFQDTPLGKRYVTASHQGVCEVRNDPAGYGIHVRIYSPDGSMTIYGHLTKVYVKNKQRVAQGQRIGLTGNTGFSTGAHLHFGYRPVGWERNQKNGYFGWVDPRPFLPRV